MWCSYRWLHPICCRVLLCCSGRRGGVERVPISACSYDGHDPLILLLYVFLQNRGSVNGDIKTPARPHYCHLSTFTHPPFSLRVVRSVNFINHLTLISLLLAQLIIRVPEFSLINFSHLSPKENQYGTCCSKHPAN